MSSEKHTDAVDTQENGTVKEFSNSNITVQVHRLPGSQVTMEIHVTPQATLAAYKKAIKAVNKEVSLPGFRIGKAPEAMLIQNYSSYIDQEWKEILLQATYKEAVTLTDTYPLNENSLKKPQIKKIDSQNGSHILFEFEAFPDVPQIRPAELKLHPVQKQEVTEEKIQDQIETILHHYAEWQEIENRPVEEGDYVDLDIDDIDHPETPICKETRFEVAKGKIGNWMHSLLLGKNVNDVVSGMSEPTPELNSKAEFKPTHCKITIKSIKKAVLPELNEEFAKKVGAENLTDLNEKMRRNLEREAEEEVQENYRNQIEKQLIEKYPFDLPHSILQNELKARTDYLKRAYEKNGKDAAEIRQKIASETPSLQEEIKNSCCQWFLTRAFAEKHSIEVTQDELMQELMLQLYMKSSTLDRSMNPDEARSRVYVEILTRKVKDFLVSQATVE